jgi:SAM-dependent methyltransferase
MNPCEYDLMAELEASHWWYAGVQDLFKRLLENPQFAPGKNPNILDAGCGSGAHIQLLGGLLKPAYLGGFDLSELAVEHAAKKSPEADIYQSDLCKPEVHISGLDLILCCDVLYTTPLDEGIAGLKTVTDRLNPGGLLLLHLPAYNWLKSRHDLAVHTRQRFTKDSARRILTSLQLRVEFLSYRMCVLLPAVVAWRLPTLFRRGATNSETASSDLRPVPAPLNRLLLTALQLENRILSRGIPLPWGSSIVAVGRKP